LTAASTEHIKNGAFMWGIHDKPMISLSGKSHTSVSFFFTIEAEDSFVCLRRRGGDTMTTVSFCPWEVKVQEVADVERAADELLQIFLLEAGLKACLDPLMQRRK
jgi:hypothetical protein